MSRICVKNLPKHVSEDRLRELFSQKGEITDAKLMRTKDGKSRQFAFIGFRTEQEAVAAMKYFNKSYLDTSRIICEVARKVGDPDAPRPWSRYSSKKLEKEVGGGEETPNAKKRGIVGAKVDKKSMGVSENNDPQLQEFLEVMQTRAKSKIWANDLMIAPSANQDDQVTEKEPAEKEEVKKKSVPVDLEQTKTKVSKKSDADEESEVPAKDDGISDMEYFKSRMKKDWSDSDSDDDSSSSDADTDEETEDASQKSDDEGASIEESLEGRDSDKVSKGKDFSFSKVGDRADAEEGPPEDADGEVQDPGNPLSTLKEDKDEVFESNRLFVRNLPYTATEDELEELFSNYGNLKQVHLVVNKDTKRSKGIAYILYSLPESAARALEELDNTIFQGRLLHVMPSKAQNISEKQGADFSATQGSNSFKKKREEEKKASEASGDTRAWNALFMRPDTVVENIARKFGVSKSNLLDREADDLAVRIALGETQVIADTKKALANAGVNVTSLEEFAAGKTDGVKRSNHVLLVKNLPYGSSESELGKMFGKFGTLDKIILPPSKAMALVVFLEPSEARAAFKGLAYKRYKDAPLYLEWAPGSILEKSASDNDENNVEAVGERDAKRAIREHVEGISDVDIDPDRVESRSIYVKNLNFKTSNESLKEHFIKHMKGGKIQSVRVMTHMKNGKQLSKGDGFIEFDSVETATSVRNNLQGTVLDGHALILQPCHAKKDERASKNVEKNKSETKLLVRNVAFEATQKDLSQLFSPFGQVKSIRLPKKIAGGFKGFAFVEFVTKQEAQNALKALSSTHLYGRHLVIERANEGETLEQIRARTTAHFTDEQNGFQNSAKLSKKRKSIDFLDDDGKMKFGRMSD